MFSYMINTYVMQSFLDILCVIKPFKSLFLTMKCAGFDFFQRKWWRHITVPAYVRAVALPFVLILFHKPYVRALDKVI